MGQCWSWASAPPTGMYECVYHRDTGHSQSSPYALGLSQRKERNELNFVVGGHAK
jgi:hypothetical protein